jgi:hypothetical protein
MTHQSAKTFTLATCAIPVLVGCVHVDVSGYCKYSEKLRLRDADPNSLAFVLGAPEDLVIDETFIKLYSPSTDDPKFSVQLDLQLHSERWPSGLNESRCTGVNWRTYDVSADASQWESFWRDAPHQSNQFQFGLIFPKTEKTTKVRLRSFGLAVVDGSSGDPFMSCGCYWK